VKLAHRRAEGGEWEQMSRGVYRLLSSGRSASTEQRTIAANLAVEDSIVIGWFAARIHGLPVLQTLDGQAVSLAVTITRRSRLPGVRRCRGLIPSQPWRTGRVATPVLTIVTLAALRATRHQLETVLDAALTRRLVTVARIEKLLTTSGWLRFPGRPLLVSLLVERTGGKALFRSQTEARVKRWLKENELDGGLPNHIVETASGPVEVDVAWPAQFIALEISPFWTHGSRKTQQRDIDRRAALVARGWRVVEADDRHLGSRRAFQPKIEALKQLLQAGL
jgi:hypothetical protein